MQARKYDSVRKEGQKCILSNEYAQSAEKYSY